MTGVLRDVRSSGWTPTTPVALFLHGIDAAGAADVRDFLAEQLARPVTSQTAEGR